MAGTSGAIVTCPLEVVKTRLQSSNSGFDKQNTGTSSSSSSKGASTTANKVRHFNGVSKRHIVAGLNKRTSPSFHYQQAVAMSTHHHRQTLGVVQCLKHIVETEGPRGLFRGLGPNLVGVAPSRAIYFFAYSTTKRNVNESLPKRNRDTPFVHVVSAFTAGFMASTCTNPLWLVKTRLQLDRASGNKALTVRKCVANIYKEKSVVGFWKGVTASYWGIAETVIHFVVYEFLKAQLREAQLRRPNDSKNFLDFAGAMLCGACSKTCATIIAYPHGEFLGHSNESRLSIAPTNNRNRKTSYGTNASLQFLSVENEALFALLCLGCHKRLFIITS